MFVEEDTDKHKLIKIEQLLNKYTIKKDKDLAIEYFIG